MPRTPVVIVERNDDFFVEPPIVVMSKGSPGGGGNAGAPPDSVMIINTTSEDLVLRIESASPFGAAVLQVLGKRGSPGGTSRVTMTVAASASDGEYPYQVLMIQSGKKARGNSDPMIIIDN